MKPCHLSLTHANLTYHSSSAIIHPNNSMTIASHWLKQTW